MKRGTRHVSKLIYAIFLRQLRSAVAKPYLAYFSALELSFHVNNFFSLASNGLFSVHQILWKVD